MQELNTRTVVKQFATNCMDWLHGVQLLRMARVTGDGLSLTLISFRSYLDKFLSNMVEFRVSTDWELDLGHYHISSSADKDYVVVKRSKRRLPRTPAKYIGWVDWDIHNYVPEEDSLRSMYVKEIYCRNKWYFGKEYTLHKRVSIMHASILSQVLLQSLFNLLGEVDLVNKPLPSEDVRCRIGSYEMLYDHLMQEWRIWKKS